MPPTYSGTLRKRTTLNLAALSGEISQIWLTIYNTFQDDENVSVESILFKSKDIDKNSESSRKNNNKRALTDTC